MRLETFPLPVKEACAFVTEHHRHLPAPVGGLWAIGAFDRAQAAVVGVRVALGAG